jgi:phage protein D
MSFFISGDYRVTIGGQDVTNRFRPLLKDLKVDRSAKEASDSCSLTLADKDGLVFLPQERMPVSVELKGQWAFDGFVSDVNSTGSKGSGRELKVTARSIDEGGKAKQPSLRHKDKATLQSVASEWGSKAGIQMSVLGSLADVERDYWIQQNESFVAWGQRIAREVGGTLKIIGSRGFLSPRNEGISMSGRALTPIAAVWGDNLLDWDISPIINRPKFNQVSLSYFDRAKGERVEVDVDTGIASVDSKLRALLTVANEAQARKRGEAHGKESDREKGGGNITIIGNALAEPEAICTIVGARPGIDGSYQIDTVSHSVSKSSGFTTAIGIKQPKGGAGTDTRGTRPSTSSIDAPNNMAADTTVAFV